MARHSKRYANASRSYDKAAAHDPVEAITLVKANASTKFDETVELALKLGIDARKADQMVRGTVSLPNGTGKDVRVAVFAEADTARQAEEAGADLVGGEDLAEQIQGGMLDFDVAIASPDMMRVVGKLGKVLGPRGLMPNPKSGTVTPDVADAVAQFKAGRVEYRNDKFGNVHMVIGKASFEVPQLVENYVIAVDEIQRAKPAAAKGAYIRGVTISSTMGPGVKIDPSKALPDEEEAPIEQVAAEMASEAEAVVADEVAEPAEA